MTPGPPDISMTIYTLPPQHPQHDSITGRSVYQESGKADEQAFLPRQAESYQGKSISPARHSPLVWVGRRKPPPKKMLTSFATPWYIRPLTVNQIYHR